MPTSMPFTHQGIYEAATSTDQSSYMALSNYLAALGAAWDGPGSTSVDMPVALDDSEFVIAISQLLLFILAGRRTQSKRHCFMLEVLCRFMDPV
jgi:hypothetical protein